MTQSTCGVSGYATVHINSLRPRQNGRHFADDIFNRISLNENIWIPIKISLKFVPKGPINNTPVLVQIMAWRRRGDKPLSEPRMISLPTHICVTRPQWVNWNLILRHALRSSPASVSQNIVKCFNSFRAQCMLLFEISMPNGKQCGWTHVLVCRLP